MELAQKDKEVTINSDEPLGLCQVELEAGDGGGREGVYQLPFLYTRIDAARYDCFGLIKTVVGVYILGGEHPAGSRLQFRSTHRDYYLHGRFRTRISDGEHNLTVVKRSGSSQ